MSSLVTKLQSMHKSSSFSYNGVSDYECIYILLCLYFKQRVLHLQTSDCIVSIIPNHSFPMTNKNNYYIYILYFEHTNADYLAHKE